MNGRVVWLLLMLFVLPLAPGCGGCSDDAAAEQAAKAKENEKKKKEEEEKKKKEKEKPKPDFERLKLTAMPHDGVDLTQSVKPGHWVSATLETKANNFDFGGDLETSILNSAGHPIDLEHTAYQLLTSRPAVLPKGQAKRLEVLFYVPRSTNTTVATRLFGRGGGAEVLQDRQPVTHLPAYQYHFYVMASQPERYRYLKVLNSVRPPHDDLPADRDRDLYYRVQLPRVGQSVSLPSHPLVWTSIAYLLWDDVHPKVLRTDQQRAMLDWLHWGGQIIISGPRTLDHLRGSFLEPYLPATGGESISLDAAAVAELSRHWTVPPNSRALGLPLAVTQPWSAVKLTKHENASDIPGTGGLLVERRIGRGRIVVSAFRLNERDLISWRSFDSLVNAALLRHPPRFFYEGPLAASTVDWVDPLNPGPADAPHLLRNARFDPGIVSDLRYFSRDGGTEEERSKAHDLAGLPADIAEQLANDANLAGAGLGAFAQSSVEQELFEDERRIAHAEHQPGVAGWSDFTPVAQAARESLREAAGIVVPRRTFVVWVVGLYLLVIVPLNWLVFWALGRVEWAWVAAPAIAIGCAMMVVKLARLDIGFARSKTEVAVVELHGGYPRAHVTRFTALYSSLSTPYSVHFDDPSALAAPFSTDPGFRLLMGQSARPVVFRRDREVNLTGYQISSNSTGMLHTEHMLNLDGALTLLHPTAHVPRVVNGTGMALDGAMAIRLRNRTPEYAWIGTFRPRQETALDFKTGQAADAFRDQHDQSAITADKPPIGTISLKSLIRIAAEAHDMNEGDIRLIAWTEQEVPGMRIEPRSSQQRHATLVLANLHRGLGPKPIKDINLGAEPKPEDEDDEFLMPDDSALSTGF